MIKLRFLCPNGIGDCFSQCTRNDSKFLSLRDLRSVQVEAIPIEDLEK